MGGGELDKIMQIESKKHTHKTLRERYIECIGVSTSLKSTTPSLSPSSSLNLQTVQARTFYAILPLHIVSA